MTFPVAIPLGPLRLDAHWLVDLVAYAGGFRLYLAARRHAGDPIDNHSRWWIVAAAIAGAAVGSKVLFWFEDPAETLAHRHDLAFLIGGKTIVGGLVGGWAAVELTKRLLGIRRRTGDVFAAPLALAMAIGRIGCFLGGLPDRTVGIPSSLPWAVDFGDGVPRHPTQLYEAVLLAGLALWLRRLGRRPHLEGDVFKCFMVAYMAMRVAMDAIKPEVRIALGLSSLQWTALVVLAIYTSDIRRWLTSGLVSSANQAPSGLGGTRA